MKATLAKIHDLEASAKTVRERAATDALGMIRAIERKMKELAARVERVSSEPAIAAKTPFGHEDAAVGEVLTLMSKLSQLSGGAFVDVVLEELLAAGRAEAEQLAKAKPAAAAPPVETGEGEEKTDQSIDVPDLDEPETKPKKGAKK